MPVGTAIGTGDDRKWDRMKLLGSWSKVAAFLYPSNGKDRQIWGRRSWA